MSASSRSFRRKTDELDGINPLATSSMDTWNTGSSLKKPTSTWETGTMNFGGWYQNTDPRTASSASSVPQGVSTGTVTSAVNPQAVVPGQPTAEQMNAYYMQMQMMQQMMNPAMAAMMNPNMMAAMQMMQTPTAMTASVPTGIPTATAAVSDKTQNPVTKAPLTYGEYKKLQRMKSEPGYNQNDDFGSSKSPSYGRGMSMESYRSRSDPMETHIKQEKPMENDPRYYTAVANDARERELQKQLELQRLQLERQQQQLFLQQQQLLKLQETTTTTTLKPTAVIPTKPKETIDLSVEDEEWNDAPKLDAREPILAKRPIENEIIHDRSPTDRSRKHGRDRDEYDRRQFNSKSRRDSRSKSKDRDDYGRRRRDEWEDDRATRFNRERNDRNDRNERGGFGRNRFNRFDDRRDDRRFDRREEDWKDNRNRGAQNQNRNGQWRRGDSPNRRSRFGNNDTESPARGRQDDSWDETPTEKSAQKKTFDENWDDGPSAQVDTQSNKKDDDFWNTDFSANARARDKSRFPRKTRFDRSRSPDKRAMPMQQQHIQQQLPEMSSRNPPAKVVRDDNWDDEDEAPKPWNDNETGIPTKASAPTASAATWDEDFAQKENVHLKRLNQENWDDDEIAAPSKWVEPMIGSAPEVREDLEENWDNDDFGPPLEWIERPLEIAVVTEEMLNEPVMVPPPDVAAPWEMEEKEQEELKTKIASENWDDDDSSNPWTNFATAAVTAVATGNWKNITAAQNIPTIVPPPTPVPAPIPPPPKSPEPVNFEEEYYLPDFLNPDKDMNDSVEMEIDEDDKDDDDNLPPPGISSEEFQQMKIEKSKFVQPIVTSECSEEPKEISNKEIAEQPIDNEVMSEIVEKPSAKRRRSTDSVESENDSKKPRRVSVENPQESNEIVMNEEISKSSDQLEIEQPDSTEKPQSESDEDEDDIDNWDLDDFGVDEIKKLSSKDAESNQIVIECEPEETTEGKKSESPDADEVETIVITTEYPEPMREEKPRIKIEAEEEQIQDQSISSVVVENVPVKSESSVKKENSELLKDKEPIAEIEKEIQIEKEKPKEPTTKKIVLTSQGDTIKSEMEVEEFSVTVPEKHQDKSNSIESSSTPQEISETIETEEIIWDDVNVVHEVELESEVKIEEEEITEQPVKATLAKSKKAAPAKRGRRRRKAWTTRKKPKTTKKAATVVQEEIEEDLDDEDEEEND